MLNKIFSRTDMSRVTHSPSFVSTVTSNGKTYNIRYEMTEPTASTVQGPFTVKAIATAADGSGVLNAEKSFQITTTTKVYTIGFVKMDTTTATQINVGSATDKVTTDQPAPTATTQLDAVYAKGIVDGIKDFAGKASNQALVDAATSIVVTLVGSDGGVGKTITITVAAGDADDEAKVLAALATATIA